MTAQSLRYPSTGSSTTRHTSATRRPSEPGPSWPAPQHVYDVWSAGFEGAYHYGRAFVLTMHPHVIGRPGRLRMLERLIDHIRGHTGVQFSRAIDVANMWTE